MTDPTQPKKPDEGSGEAAGADASGGEQWHWAGLVEATATKRASALRELEVRLEQARAEPADPTAHIDALNALAWELRAKDVERANSLAMRAYQLSVERGYALGRAWAARTRGMTIVDAEDLKQVFSLAEEARHYFDEADDAYGRAASRDFLSTLHEFVGDLSGGLDLALDALGIARELGDPRREGYALSSVGGILAASGQVEDGVSRLQQALAIFEELGDSDGVGSIANRLCKVCREADRFEEARRFADICLELAEHGKDEFLACAVLTLVAEIEHEQGRLTEALETYRRAIGARDRIDTQAAREVVGTDTEVGMARVLIESNQLEAAETLLRELIARIGGNTVSVVDETAAHETLAALCERQGRLGDCIEHLRQAQTLREQVTEREARSKLAQVEARAAVEAAKKDAEIHKLRYVELHAMQSKLVEAERMAVLGRLAAGTAHELNTPLGALRSNAKTSASATERLLTLIQNDASVSETTRAQSGRLATVLGECQRTSEHAVERIGAIAERLARFTQLDQAERRAFDVREGLEDALALLAPTTPEGVTVERHLGEVPHVEGWPRELNHAFMTVLQNATQAIDDAGTVRVETSASDDGARVLVRVSDDGRGMSEEQVAHLFDVAWSERGDTRTRMRLGLSAAYATAKRHGGHIEVESALGDGTVVTFSLPAAPAK